MDRNDLLAATRTEFVRGYTAILDELLNESMARLFERAEHAGSMQQQGLYFDARTVLMTRSVQIRQQLSAALQPLLNRSFQTAYSTFRPSFAEQVSKKTTLSLVSTDVIDDEMWVDGVTKRLRDEADEQLRDLNIRMALLFEQETISERENPFRPYLLAKCLSSAAEGLDLSKEIENVLTEALANELVKRVSQIYAAVNGLLAQHGIAAELSLRIVRQAPASPAPMPAAPELPVEPTAETPPVEADMMGMPRYPEYGASAPAPAWHAAAASTSHPAAPAGRVEDRLLQLVRQPQQAGTSALGSMQDHWQSASQHAGGVPGAGMSAGPASASPTDSAPRSGWRSWLEGPRKAGQVLRQLFSGAPAMEEAGSGEPVRSFQPSSNSVLTHSIDSLMRTATPQTVDMHDDQGQLRNLILEHRETLSDQVEEENEQMTIDIVAMLFEFILRDQNVPAEVRAQLGRLQFLVLKVALMDPTLLTQKSHPARMLVNRIGSISLGLQQIDPTGERVAGEICHIVETLLSSDIEGSALFGTMLDELDAFIARELRSNEPQVDSALAAVAQAESRTLQFARITAMIGEALQGVTIDQYLQEFLLNHWARAIEVAGRTDATRARRFREAIPQLIWSIVPKVTESDRAALTAMLPKLIGTLRDGMLLSKSSKADLEQLMAWLFDSHKLALRSAVPANMCPPLSFFQQRFQHFIEQGEPLQVITSDRSVTPDRKLLEEAMSELETQLNLIDQLFEDELADEAGLSDADFSNAEVEQEELGAYAQLRSGVAVEVNLDGNPTLALLSWSDPTVPRMVLQMQHSEAPSIISVRLFIRLLKSGRARFLEDRPIFERAIESLLDSADQLDRTPLAA
ncbi:DUF1631 family protein [Leeia aquatica]|uniref:DUF1631 domain-containing protein n=1 Tax=Leeia aquatica TaxID=2725557 RepID=A0A847S8Q3_9NEIS|nr:DUF1631 family protein [Leeia aquatica]NLR73739.1 DUF1631 domain-containing protein [Leeia aquatica]